MNYQETTELERNIKIKNKAEEIVIGFKYNVTLNLATKKGNRFTIWSDSHNATYVEITPENIVYIAVFLHENYRIVISESAVFNGIVNGDRVIEHIASAAKVSYNPYEYKI